MHKQSPNNARRNAARSHRHGRDWPLGAGSSTPESRPDSGPESGTDTATRRCDHPDCNEEGQHRAPQSRDALRSWYWFCLDHVREYNKSWNYYADMSDGEVEAERRKDTFWHRPTWPLGRKGGFNAEIHDPFDLFNDGDGPSESEDEARTAFRENSPELAALATMDLKPPLTIQNLKSRYKELVKRYHPDANGGDRQAEDRLKDINQAYATLIRSLGG